MTMGEAVAKRINELLFERGWSLYRLSKEGCIALSTLKNFYTNHTKSPTLSMIFKVADAFGLSPIEFLDSPIFKSENLEVD